MVLRLLRNLGCGLAAVLVLPAGPARAEVFTTRYTVSYLGIPIARSRFSSTIEGDRFAIESSLNSSGIARIFDSTEGTVSVSGRLGGERPRPDAFVIAYRSGDKNKRTALRFADDRVAAVENIPPLKKRKNKVPVKPDDLRAVADPFSATLVKAENLNAVCRRTIRVFDGETRADLKLSFAKKAEWNGVPAVTCAVRFVPVSGFRRDKKEIAYLRDRSRISVTFAELGETGVYAPVRASIGTQIGTVTVSADAPR